MELPNLQFRQATQSFDRSEDGCITVLSIKQAIANPYNGVKGIIHLTMSFGWVVKMTVLRDVGLVDRRVCMEAVRRSCTRFIVLSQLRNE